MSCKQTVRPIEPQKTPVMAVGVNGDADKDDGGVVDSDEEVMAALSDDSDLDRPLCKESEKNNGMDEEEVEKHKCIKIPTEPTPQQRIEHRCTHWPYRSWCRDCNFGRGQHDHHRRKKGEKVVPGVPTISIDFVFLGTEHVKAQDNTFLFMYDNVSETPWTYRTGKKGIPRWLVSAMLQDLENAGYGNSRICIRSDQERVIMKLKRLLIHARTGETVPQESPVRESQCNGKMEQAVKAFEGQVRTFMCALESETNVKISPQSRAYGFLTTWACTVLTRYRLTPWGKSPFELLTGHKCPRPLISFGTPVIWKRALKHPDRAKGESDWGQGLFLGVKWRTSEAIIAVGDSIVLCRTVRADPETREATEAMLASIPQHAIEFLYSQNEDPDAADDYEPNTASNSEK